MRKFIFTMILFAFPAIGLATPPQIVGIEEQAIGVNDTHLFVLRILNDNLGQYQTTQTDVLLIARNRTTNIDDQFWPVMRVLDNGVDFAINEELNRIEVLPFGEKVNPYAVLLWRKARPLLGRTGASANEDRQTVVISTNSITFEKPWSDFKFVLNFADVTDMFTTSLQAGRAAAPAYFIEGGEYGNDMLANVTFDPAIDCSFDEFLPVFEKNGEDYVTSWFAKVTCANDWTMAGISIYMQMNVVPK